MVSDLPVADVFARGWGEVKIKKIIPFFSTPLYDRRGVGGEVTIDKKKQNNKIIIPPLIIFSSFIHFSFANLL